MTNVDINSCILDGYPGVTLISAKGAALPFEYRRGGDQMVTATQPHEILLAAMAVAYVNINKYRCDLRDGEPATALLLTPPENTIALQISIVGARDMSYCGPGDPGSKIDISPVESSARDAFPSP
jgi:hypothetical protein